MQWQLLSGGATKKGLVDKIVRYRLFNNEMLIRLVMGLQLGVIFYIYKLGTVFFLFL